MVRISYLLDFFIDFILFIRMPIISNSVKIKKDYSTADLLKCGSCSTEFLLSDILVFIQHKSKKCKIERSTYGECKSFN
jgi:hypothetical protein